MKLTIILLLLSFLSACTSGRSISSLQHESLVLKQELEKIRIQYKLPSLGAVLVNEDGVIEVAVTGKRAFDHSEEVTVNDLYHLGSNTKSMTAMLLAKEIELGHFKWNSTLEDSFTSYAIHPSLQKVSLVALLRHKGGVTNTVMKSYPELWKKFSQMQGVSKPIEQRVLLSKRVLREKSVFKTNSKSHYSNAGITLVGHAIELKRKLSYEDSLKLNLFEPLDMKSCGFGAPGSKGSVDQPRGHVFYQGQLYSIPPTPTADNPDAISPAGKVHCSLADWGKYISNHLAGSKKDTSYLKKTSYSRLHSPLTNDVYALGWLKLKAPWNGKSDAIFHNGSNTMNYAEMWFSSEDNIGIGVVTNIGNDAAMKAVREAVSSIVKKRLK